MAVPVRGDGADVVASLPVRAGAPVTCQAVEINGVKMIVCGGRRSKPKRCAVCRRRDGVRLCDASKCNMPLCDVCTTPMGPDGDLCPGHAGSECEHEVIPHTICGVKCSWCDQACGTHRPPAFRCGPSAPRPRPMEQP